MSHKLIDEKDPALTLDEGLKQIEPEIFDNLVWLSTKDAARYLRKFRRSDGVTPSDGAIRTEIWRGHLKPRKLRGRLYFHRHDLERHLLNAPFKKEKKRVCR